MIFKAYTAISLLTLPHSNAEIERLFSQMNIVKTKVLNRLQLSMLNSILTIRSGRRRKGYSEIIRTEPQRSLNSQKTKVTG